MPMDASYSFGYESLESSRNEAADPSGNVQGNFTYTDENGRPMTVVYKAGKGTGVVFLRDDREKAIAEAQQQQQTAVQKPYQPASKPLISGGVRPAQRPVTTHVRPIIGTRPVPSQIPPRPLPGTGSQQKPQKAIVLHIRPANPQPPIPKPPHKQPATTPSQTYGPPKPLVPAPRPVDTYGPPKPVVPAQQLPPPPQNTYGSPRPAPQQVQQPRPAVVSQTRPVVQPAPQPSKHYGPPVAALPPRPQQLPSQRPAVIATPLPQQPHR